MRVHDVQNIVVSMDVPQDYSFHRVVGAVGEITNFCLEWESKLDEARLRLRERHDAS